VVGRDLGRERAGLKAAPYIFLAGA
jgi:hypothetical protein